MGALANPKHERFCQELAKGKTADEAYVLAGYIQNRKNASRLKTNEDIAVRLSELQERSVVRTEVTLQWLLDQAIEVLDLAKTNGQTGPAVAAIKELGILSGKRIEKRETGQPGDFDRMSDDELDAFIRAEASALGIGPGGKEKADRQTNVRGKSSRLHS